MLRKGKQGLKDIYVVGCGQSLKGFNWTLLTDKTTIAVNGSLSYVPNPDYFLTADSRYAIIAAQKDFYNIPTYKILVISPTHRCFKLVRPFISKYDHLVTPKYGNSTIGFNEDEFGTGQNSGFCGMQLAVILGAETIHLLGMDFCGEGKGNFHNRYQSCPRKWDEFLSNFKVAVKVLKEHDIEVVSHSPISKLNDTIEYKDLHG